MHTLCYVLATAYILFALVAGYYCGKIFHSEFAGMFLGGVGLLFVAALLGLHHDQVHAFWQVLVAGIATYFLITGTTVFLG